LPIRKEDVVTFEGGSFVTDPDGRIIAKAPLGEDCILYCDMDLGTVEASHARRHFLKGRRPGIYGEL